MRTLGSSGLRILAATNAKKPGHGVHAKAELTAAEQMPDAERVRARCEAAPKELAMRRHEAVETPPCEPLRSWKAAAPLRPRAPPSMEGRRELPLPAALPWPCPAPARRAAAAASRTPRPGAGPGSGREGDGAGRPSRLRGSAQDAESAEHELHFHRRGRGGGKSFFPSRH